MFTPQQVKQFKEAFNMMDQDGDGRVDEKDLRAMLTNLGESPTASPSRDATANRYLAATQHTRVPL